jgi:hypothetical protein
VHSVNLWAVLVSAVAGFVIGGVYYRALAKPWMAAHGFTREMVRAHHGKGARLWPLVILFGAELAMAFVLAGAIWHAQAYTVRGGLISGAIVWAGFVLTTLAVNNSFGLRSPKLIAIDGGHWLLVLLAIGAIVGGWGL